MAYTPYPTYQNREAMLRALQGGGGVVNNQNPQTAPQPAPYTYPNRNQIEQGRYASGTAGKIADIGGALAPTVARQFAPKVASSLVEGGMKSAGMGGAASMGLGLATELGGSLLKPKGDLPTASPFADITDKYERRMEGSGEGIAGGAVKWGGRGAQIGSAFGGPIGMGIGAGIGALGGAIGNAFTKNAKSAMTDFSREDAVKAINELYATKAGRLPEAGEVERILLGGGTKAGDKWVGEKQLYNQLNDLSGNFASEAAQDPTGHAGQVLAGRNPLFAGGGAEGGGPVAAQLPVLPGGDTGVAGPVEGAAGAAGAPLPNSEKWNTDNYAKPAHVATAPASAPPPGWDAKKWNNPDHQTPKYVIGRILSQYPPKTENMDAVVAEIAKAYPGARRTGSGDITIPGIGSTDILQAADVGGKGWQFSGLSGGKGKSGGGKGGGVDTSGIQAAADAARGYAEDGDIAGGSDIASIIKRLGQYAGSPDIRGVSTARDAVLRGLR